jgi:hypothetical protein
MKTISFRANKSLTTIAFVVAMTLVVVRPAFAQRVIGNIYPDTTDSPESPAVRDPGNAADFGPYSLSEPDLAPAPRDVYSEPAPKTGSLSRGFVAPESSAQRVTGNIYPDSTDSQEPPAIRDPGNSADFGSYSPSDTDLAPAPREYAEPQTAPMYGQTYAPSYGGFASESAGSPWMQRPQGAFAQPWVNPSTTATVPMRQSSPVFSSSPGSFRPFH